MFRAEPAPKRQKQSHLHVDHTIAEDIEQVCTIFFIPPIARMIREYFFYVDEIAFTKQMVDIDPTAKGVFLDFYVDKKTGGPKLRTRPRSSEYSRLVMNKVHLFASECKSTLMSSYCDHSSDLKLVAVRVQHDETKEYSIYICFNELMDMDMKLKVLLRIPITADMRKHTALDWQDKNQIGHVIMVEGMTRMHLYVVRWDTQQETQCLFRHIVPRCMFAEVVINSELGVAYFNTEHFRTRKEGSSVIRIQF
jgi:hypothetical protein